MSVALQIVPQGGGSDWRRYLAVVPARREALLGSVRAEWLAQMALTGGRDQGPARASTIRNYASAFDCHFTPAFGDQTLRELGEHADWVTAWLRSLSAASVAEKTRGRLLWTLSKLMGWAIDVGLADANPVAGVGREDRPKKRVKDPLRARFEVLDLASIRRILAADIPPHQLDLFTLALTTGARFGELAAVTFGDVRLDARPLGQLVLRESWDAKARVTNSTKTDRIRYAPLLPAAVARIKDARARFIARERREPTARDLLIPFIVPKSGGRKTHPWNDNTARRAWHRVLEQLDIPMPASGPRRLHATRHSYITRLYRAGADLRAIEMITHASESELPGRRSSIGEYIHLEWSDLCAAALRFQAQLEEI